MHSPAPAARSTAARSTATKFVLVIAALFALPGLARAQFADGAVTVRAEPQFTRLHPGDQFAIAVVLEFQPAWHVWPSERLGKVPAGLEGVSPEWTRVGPGSDTSWAGGTAPLPPTVAQGLTLYSDKAQWPDPHEVAIAGARGLGYSDRAIIFVPLAVAADAAPGSRAISLGVYFQACDESICVAPETVTVEVPIEVVARDVAIVRAASPLFAAFDPTVFGRLDEAPVGVPDAANDDGHLFDFFGYSFTLGGRQYLPIFLLAFVAGFLLNLTPCVLPVIPIKVLSLQKQAGNPAKLALYGSVYCVGILATFAVFGVLIAVLRQQWGELFSHPWFSATMGTIVLVLGVGMLGLFTIRLPQAVYMINPAGDTVQGNFMMGVLTAVLSTPCTGPFLGGALAWAATQPAWVGLTALVVMGAGMAFPYALLIAFPGLVDRMPRAGPGGELLKQVLGVLLIAVAFFLFGNLFLAKWSWWVVAGVSALAFVWMIAGGARVLRTPRGKAFAGAVGLLGIAASLGLGYVMTKPSAIPWRVYADSTGGIQAEIDRGLSENKVVVVKFTAKWCANCHVIEKTVFNSATGLRLMNRPGVVPIKVDLTHRTNTEGWALLAKYSGGTGIPFSMILRPGGGEPIAYRSFFKVSDLEAAIGPPIGSR